MFGAKPEMVVKGGVIAWAQMGDPNASIPTPQPVFMRPMFGAFGRATGMTSIAFVSKLAKQKGVGKTYGLTKRIEAVKGCRKVGKKDLKWNNAMPKITVDPETYEVRADGELLTCEPAKVLPLAQRYQSVLAVSRAHDITRPLARPKKRGTRINPWSAGAILAWINISHIKSEQNASDWLLWQLTDSAFPTGGFAHSLGLEAAWQHGEVRNRTELVSFIEAGLQQLGHAALPFVTAAFDEPEKLGEFDQLCDAFTTNHVANRASRAQGRAFLTAVERIFRFKIQNSKFEELPCAHFAPVFGACLRRT